MPNIYSNPAQRLFRPQISQQEARLIADALSYFPVTAEDAKFKMDTIYKFQRFLASVTIPNPIIPPEAKQLPVSITKVDIGGSHSKELPADYKPDPEHATQQDIDNVNDVINKAFKLGTEKRKALTADDL